MLMYCERLYSGEQLVADVAGYNKGDERIMHSGSGAGYCHG